MASAYDAVVEPPYRIQKRLVLNQCFKAILNGLGKQPPALTYVTFGGGQLYDLLDLVSVFDIQKSRIFVKSYEVEHDVAESARTCVVNKTLGKMNSVSIDILPNALQETTLTPLIKGAATRPFIYFLDYLTPYGLSNQADLIALIRAKCLRAGDYLMITSNLTPRVIYHSRRPFMEKQVGAFRAYFAMGAQAVSPKFRERNHVDLLVGQACSMLARESKPGPYVDCRLLGKYRYRDTTPMGVWIYKVIESARVAAKLTDAHFVDYPWPLEVTDEADVLSGDPQLFEDLH